LCAKHCPPQPRAYNKSDTTVLKEAVALYDLKMMQGDPWKKSDVAKKFGLHPRTFGKYAHDEHSK
jgi:hypothetical protein